MGKTYRRNSEEKYTDGKPDKKKKKYKKVKNESRNN